MDDFGYDGELTGKIEYHGNKKTKLDVQMDIDRMRIAESILGNLKINGNYLSDTTGKTESDFRVVMNDTSRINMAFNKEEKDGQINFRTDFSGLPLGVFESFIKKFISGLEGEVSGNLSLTSGKERPVLNGEIRISKTGLKVIPLNAGFYIHDDIIKLDNSNIVLDQFTVLDSLGKKLSLTGTIYLNDPADIKSDLEVRSDLLQVMNTSEKDNPAFYGSVFINTNLKVTGPVQKPAITGNIVLARGTIINYQYTEDLSVSETQKMITFASLSQVRDTVETKPISSKPLSSGPDV
jgi:autotransporter translocation and assembly factor TamB